MPGHHGPGCGGGLSSKELPTLCGQQTGTSAEGLLAVLGTEVGELRAKAGCPVFLVKETLSMGANVT